MKTKQNKTILSALSHLWIIKSTVRERDNHPKKKESRRHITHALAVLLSHSSFVLWSLGDWAIHDGDCSTYMGNQTTSWGLNPLFLQSILLCTAEKMTHPTQDKPTSVTGFSSSFYFLCPSVVSFFVLFCFCFYLFLWLTSRSWGRNDDWQFDNATQCRFYFEDDIGNVYGTLRENYGHTTRRNVKRKFFFFFQTKRQTGSFSSIIHNVLCCVYSIRI